MKLLLEIALIVEWITSLAKWLVSYFVVRGILCCLQIEH